MLGDVAKATMLSINAWHQCLAMRVYCFLQDYLWQV